MTSSNKLYLYTLCFGAITTVLAMIPRMLLQAIANNEILLPEGFPFNANHLSQFKNSCNATRSDLYTTEISLFCLTTVLFCINMILIYAAYCLRLFSLLNGSTFMISVTQKFIIKLLFLPMTVCLIVAFFAPFIAWHVTLLTGTVMYMIFIVASAYLAVVMFKQLNSVIKMLMDQHRKESVQSNNNKIDKNDNYKHNHEDLEDENTRKFIGVLIRLTVLVSITLASNLLGSAIGALDFIFNDKYSVYAVNIAFNLDNLTNLICLFLQFATFDKEYFKLCFYCDIWLKKLYQNSQLDMARTLSNSEIVVNQ